MAITYCDFFSNSLRASPVRLGIGLTTSVLLILLRSICGNVSSAGTMLMDSI